jgi:inorganic pyrophosphatase
MQNTVEFIIEIERHSNAKWEYDRENDRLFLDRTLKYPYFYPYAYGFVPNTIGNDGDELDVLLITETKYVNYNTDKKILKGVIVGGLMMHDEKGADEKIFVVPEDEFESFMNMSSQQKTKIHNDICWFFSNYKLFDIGKWSRVECLMDCQEAIYTYRQAKRQFADKQISPV